MLILYFLLGYRVLAVQEKDTVAFFELCRMVGISPGRISRVEKGLEITCTMPAAYRLLKAAQANEIAILVIRQGGIPALSVSLCRRPGLFLGILLGVALLCSSRLFLWDIELTGNATIKDEELYLALTNAGVKKGSFAPSISSDDVVAVLRQNDPRIAFAALHVKGTVATLQIKESDLPEVAPIGPANLVARCDGVITMPLIYEGVCLVKEGEVVRAGQLLASGLLNTDNNGLRVTRAAGQVLARTVRTYEIRVDFDYEKKIYTGKQGVEISLLFFSEERKVFKTTGNVGSTCDIIETVKWISVGNNRCLPFGYVKKQVLDYSLEPARYTTREARDVAFSLLSAHLAADSGDRRMLSCHTETILDDAGITLRCTVVGEEDIAVTKEFAPAGP